MSRAGEFFIDFICPGMFIDLLSTCTSLCALIARGCEALSGGIPGLQGMEKGFIILS